MNFKTICQIPKRIFSHSLGRGMLAYGLTFPTASSVRFQVQLFIFSENINWIKCVRYSVYGILVSAPIVYGWMALVEQVTLCPVAISLFFFTMALCDNNFDFRIARQELERKFWDSYKVAVMYWPIVQTINFTFVPYNNRIVFMSLCGLLWVIFMAYFDEHGSLPKSKSEEIEPKVFNSPFIPESETVENEPSE